MEDINNILNYSFVDLDITGFVDEFSAARRRHIDGLCAPFDAANLETLITASFEDIVHEVLAAALNKSSIECYINNGFITVDFLNSALAGFSESGFFSSDCNKIIDILQKRFEVNHRVFDRYNKNLNADGSDFLNAKVYALLAIILCVRFFKENNVNDINTVLKLNDLLLKYKWELNEKLRRLVYYSLLIEKAALRRLL